MASISGSGGNDTLAGTVDPDIISGLGGDDIIDGSAGADTIYGDTNNFTVDTDGNDQLNGGAGTDNDWLNGGRGTDYLDGGDGNDSLNGFGEMFGGDDYSPDVLIGGAGDDYFRVGYGDSVDGGSGSDTLAYIAYGANAGINANFSQLTSGGAITVGGVTLSGIEYVSDMRGTDYDDVIIAGASLADISYVEGFGGNDQLTGTSGRDTINGGNGNDILRGGLGYDSMTGGAGTDMFIGTVADLNGDSIGGLDVGESIVITNANIDNFSFGYDHGSLTFTGGVLGISGDVPGRLVASAAAGGGVQITVIEQPVATVDQLAYQLTNASWDWFGEPPHHFNVQPGGTLTVDIHLLNATEQALARAAFGAWRDIIGVNFQEVSGGAQITITHEGNAAYTEDTSSGGFTTSAWVHIGSSWLTREGSDLWTYGYQTYVHEIGHALGLGHSGNYNADGTYQLDATYANDGWSLTVMSYFAQDENSYLWRQGFSRAYAVTPMQADIVAMQSLYGLSTNTRSGDTVYGENSNAGGIYEIANVNPNLTYTIFDTGGIDTLDYAGSGMTQIINLSPESFSSLHASRGGLSIARGTIIENAIGGNGNDLITGNDVDNFIDGGGGIDQIQGGGGNDRIVYDFTDHAPNVNGGSGFDTLVVNDQATPTSYNLVAGSFEAADVIQHDAGNNAWSTMEWLFNSAWQLTNRDIRNDDGTRAYANIDFSQTASWNEAWYIFNAGGQLVSQDVHNDDGTRSFGNFDVANTENWSQVWYGHDTQDRKVTVDLFRDDGAHNWGQYDVDDHQAWTELYFIFDTQNRVASNDIRYDDGTRGWSNLDVDNAQSWSQAWFTYDMQSRLITQETRNDDGTRVWGSIDAAGTQQWSASWYGFDVENRMTSLEVRYDDSSRSWTGYDANGGQAWSSVAYLYDPTGHLYQQVTTWDDGSSTVLSL